MLKLRHPPTLLKSNFLIDIFKVLTWMLTTLKEILLAASVTLTNARETKKK